MKNPFAHVVYKIVCLVALIAGIALAPGCASRPDGSSGPDLKQMQQVSTLAAFTGTALYLAENPDSRVYFVAARDALDLLLHDRNYDPAAFASALQGLPVTELRGEKGAILVSAAVLLWDTYAQEIVKLDRTTYVAPIITAVRDGIDRALGGRTPAPDKPFVPAGLNLELRTQP